MTIQRKVGLAVVGLVGGIVTVLVGCRTPDRAPITSPMTSVAAAGPVAAAGSVAAAVEDLTWPAAQRRAVEVVATYPHQIDAYTQGLVWVDGVLYESVGLTGESEVRRVALDTGMTEISTANPADEFGEGLAFVDDRLVQLTWKSGVGHVYDRATLDPIDTFAYDGEGWGLAYDGQRLIMSDGTAELRFLDPVTYRETGRMTITEDRAPVKMLNELEYVDGYIYANVWLTPDIVIIDPSTGQVVMRLDTSALRPASTLSDKDAVANGIAYDPVGDRLFITGKRWSTLYEVRRPEV